MRRSLLPAPRVSPPVSPSSPAACSSLCFPFSFKLIRRVSTMFFLLVLIHSSQMPFLISPATLFFSDDLHGRVVVVLSVPVVLRPQPPSPSWLAHILPWIGPLSVSRLKVQLQPSRELGVCSKGTKERSDDIIQGSSESEKRRHRRDHSTDVSGAVATPRWWVCLSSLFPGTIQCWAPLLN